MTPKPLCKVYAASCAPDGGIFRYTLSEDGKLTPTGKLPLDRPMYFVKERELLHTILRAPEGFDDNSAYLSFSACADTVELDQARSTEGVVACHLCVNEGSVYAVNYLSGSLTKIGDRTVVHTPAPNMLPGRQEAPHTHCVIPSPDGKYLLCTDLGLDKIFVYDKDLNFVSECKAPKGSGVRHIIFSPNGKYLYSANELDSTVCVFAYENGYLNLLSTYGCNIQCEKNLAAAIRISADGTKLYVSQRGQDCITVFDVRNGKDLHFLSNFPCGGKSPRDFYLSPDERFLITANEVSGNLAVLRLDKNAEPTQTDSVPLPNALCVLIEN